MTILEAAAALRGRKVSSVELTRQCLKRISDLNPKHNAFITVMEESALERARRADQELARGEDLGPLHGIPVAVKDNFCTKGVRTTCGSILFDKHVPDHDAAVVEKLNAAGSVMIGKAGLHELAYGVTSNNPHYGAIRNPVNSDRIPGGSSGGSGVAVALGMAYMAMGSDTGGSIRIPAAYCGTVGLKPTFGRVSRRGVLPLDFSLDHMGPLTRSVRDAAVVLNAIAGWDAKDDTSSRRPVSEYVPNNSISIRNVRIGVPENFFFDHIDPAVKAGVDRLLKKAEREGARLTPIKAPDIAAMNVVSRVILLAEASACMENLLAKGRDRFGPDVLALFDQGRLLPATDYVNAQRLRRVMRREFNRIWEKADCLITPVAPTGAPRIGAATLQVGGRDEDVRLASTRLVRAINLLGLPALAIPCGVDHEGMPLGLQIVGQAFDEALVLRVGFKLEEGETK